MDQQAYTELACAYLQGSLSPKEKLVFFRLVQSDPTFAQILRQEMEFAQAMQALRSELPQQMKERVFQKVVKAGERELALRFFTPIMDAVLPVWLQPLFNQAKEMLA